MSDTLKAVYEAKREVSHLREAVASFWVAYRESHPEPTYSDYEVAQSQNDAMRNQYKQAQTILSNLLLRYHDETGEATIPLGDGTEQRIVIRAELGEVINLEP